MSDARLIQTDDEPRPVRVPAIELGCPDPGEGGPSESPDGPLRLARGFRWPSAPERHLPGNAVCVLEPTAEPLLDTLSFPGGSGITLKEATFFLGTVGTSFRHGGRDVLRGPSLCSMLSSGQLPPPQEFDAHAMAFLYEGPCVPEDLRDIWARGSVRLLVCGRVAFAAPLSLMLPERWSPADRHGASRWFPLTAMVPLGSAGWPVRIGRNEPFSASLQFDEPMSLFGEPLVSCALLGTWWRPRAGNGPGRGDGDDLGGDEFGCSPF